MKKPSIDSTKIKEILIKHVEKIAFAVFFLMFAGFCYSAYQTKRFPTTPDDLSRDTASIKASVVEHAWDPSEFKIRDFKKEVDVVSKPVGVTAFRWDVLPNPPMYENKV